jgi:hypothetical protein
LVDCGSVLVLIVMGNGFEVILSIEIHGMDPTWFHARGLIGR